MADLGSVCFHIDTLETAVWNLTAQVERIADVLDWIVPPEPEEER